MFVVLFIIILLLFIAFVWSWRREEFVQTGGEYKLLKTDDEYRVGLSPSVSQYVLDMAAEEAKHSMQNSIIGYRYHVGEALDIGNAHRLLEESSDFLRTRKALSYNGYACFTDNENRDKYISDTHIDALLIADICERVFGVCEYQPFASERSGFDIVNANMFSHGTQIMTMIINTIGGKDFKELRDAAMKKVKEIPIQNDKHPKDRQERSSSIYRYAGKYVCNTVYANIIEYKNHSIVGAPKYFQLFSNIVLSEFNPNNTVRVFLEFVYEKFDDNSVAYRNIHQTTENILKHICDTREKHPELQIAIIRLYVENNGNVVDFNMPDLDNTNMLLDTGRGFQNIVIPSTKKEFKYDEYIDATSKGNNYHIQIEHSEGLQKHKSNLVEFILRQHKPEADTIALLNYFGYNMHDNRYTTVNEAGKGIDVPKTSVIYKANTDFCIKHMKIAGN